MGRRWSARRATERHGAILREKGAKLEISDSERCLKAREARRRGRRRRGVEMSSGQCAESDGSWRREGGGASKQADDCGGRMRRES